MSTNSRMIDVMIAGAQKAGTTSLAAYIEQHPQIETHSDIEITFFIKDDEYQLGYDNIFDNYFSSVHEDTVLMGKSAGIMYSQTAMHRLYEHNQNCKIIVILRNPIARAHSAYWYMRQLGFETAKTFSEALKLESSRLEKNDLRGSLLAYRDRGVYSRQIQNLYNYFGINNVHILLLDDLIANPDDSLEKIFKFACIDITKSIDTGIKKNETKMAKSELLSQVMVSDGNLKQIFKKMIPPRYLRVLKNSVKQMNERSFQTPEIDPKIKSELIEFFRPHNQDLETMLGKTLNHWNG